MEAATASLVGLHVVSQLEFSAVADRRHVRLMEMTRVPAMTKVCHAGGALAFGVALICAGGAAAQSMPAPPGAVAGTERISGNVRGQVIYASNVAGGDTTIANLRGLTPEDITYDLGTTINLRLPAGRQLLFLTASADLQRHARNSVLNAENYSVIGGGTGRVGACTGSAVGNYSRNQTQAQDLTVVVQKNIASQDGLSASVSCGSGALFASAQGSFTKLTNSATSAGFIGSESGSGSVSVGYQNKSLGNVSLGAQYSKTRYTNDPAIALGAPDGFEQYGVNLTYSRRLGLRLNGTASVNLTSLKTPATILQPASTSNNLGSDIALNYRVSSRLGLSLGYTLSNQASPTVNASFVRVDSLHVSGTYTLNQRVSVHLGGSKSRTEYRGGQPVGFLQARKSDDQEIDAGASLRVGRKISVTLDASHTDRQADLSTFNFSSNQVTLGLTGTF
jgi:hypothetical protein